MLKSIILLTALVSSGVYAQPYYYYFKYNSTYNVPGYSGDIYRLNLATNNSELFVSNVGRVNSLIFYNSDQSRIFFQVRFSLATVYVNDPSLHIRYVLGGINEIDGVKDSPGTNRYFITFDDEQDSTITVIMDRQTMQPIDTIGEVYQYNPFLSRDNRCIYRFQPDSTGIYFSKLIVSNKEGELPQRCGNIVPVESFVILSDAIDGLALVSYENNPGNDFSGVEYVLCDVDRNVTFIPFNFPWRSDGYLSSDGEYAMTEQVNFDTSRVGGEYRPGNVCVFDSHAGTLLQRLKLPPEGQMLLFDKYPNMLYYYYEKKQSSINIDLTKLPTIGSIGTQNILVGSGAFTLSVTGKNFTPTSKVQLNGTNRATTFIADTLLQATIRAADVDTAQAVYIAVRDSIAPSSHATTDSLALNVVSVPQQSLQPILDCVTQIDDTTYTAWFGYENDDTTSICVPIGPQNKFSPAPNDRTQPTVFGRGRKDNVFSVVFNGKNLTWKLNGNEVVASKKSPKCNQ